MQCWSSVCGTTVHEFHPYLFYSMATTTVNVLYQRPLYRTINFYLGPFPNQSQARQYAHTQRDGIMYATWTNIMGAQIAEQ